MDGAAFRHQVAINDALGAYVPPSIVGDGVSVREFRAQHVDDPHEDHQRSEKLEREFQEGFHGIFLHSSIICCGAQPKPR